MRSDDIRCRFVLGACYRNERIYGGDRMAKYWSDCSAEEKAEVKQIEKEQKALREQFKMGAISHRKYSYRLTRLIRRLDEVERKYATEEM